MRTYIKGVIMRYIKYISFLFILLLAAGCTTSRLGYPVESVEMPAGVTLFSTITGTGVLDNQMPLISRDLFNALYKRKYEEMIDQVPVSRLQSRLNDLFLEKTMKATSLFSPSPVHVYNWNIKGDIPVDDKKALSSYNFSVHKDQIPSPYVLALTIDEWGYIVETDMEEDGPYLSITIQLIRTETNERVWGYNSQFQQSTGEKGHGTVNLEDIEKIYLDLIDDAVSKYFKRLTKK
jgi:hypothetical protein